jgi:hypothetical protein
MDTARDSYGREPGPSKVILLLATRLRADVNGEKEQS